METGSEGLTPAINEFPFASFIQFSPRLQDYLIDQGLATVYINTPSSHTNYITADGDPAQRSVLWMNLKEKMESSSGKGYLASQLCVQFPSAKTQELGSMEQTVFSIVSNRFVEHSQPPLDSGSQFIPYEKITEDLKAIVECYYSNFLLECPEIMQQADVIAQQFLKFSIEELSEFSDFLRNVDFHTKIHVIRSMMMTANVFRWMDKHPGDEDVIKVWQQHPDLEEEKGEMMVGSLVHDVGKTTISPEILNSPNKLTLEERVIVETHPQAGVDTIEQATGHPMKKGLVWNMIKYHHYMANGYPLLEAGDVVFEWTKLFNLIDILEARTGQRPYPREFSTVPDILMYMKKTYVDDSEENRAKPADRRLDPAHFAVFVKSLMRLAPSEAKETMTG